MQIGINVYMMTSECQGRDTEGDKGVQSARGEVLRDGEGTSNRGEKAGRGKQVKETQKGQGSENSRSCIENALRRSWAWPS